MVKERWREKRRKRMLLKERCVDPFSSTVFEEIGLMDGLGSFKDAWIDFHSDS